MKKKMFILISAVSLALAAGAQWTIDSVNTAGIYAYSGATSEKAVFTNGGEWNAFNALSNVHTWGSLSITRTMLDVVSYGEKVYFGGGKHGYFTDPQYTNKVDVYDATTDSWSTLTLSKAREVGGAGAAGNKVVFAGGTGRTDISGPVYMYNTADIFDATTGVRTTGKLSKARSNIAVGASGNKIVFAGGWFWDMSYNILSANTVDIYDALAGTWTKTTLSSKRENIAVAVVGTKIIFAGGTSSFGGPMTDVDIYDVSNDTWTTTNLPTARNGMKSVVVGTNAYFAGGLFDPSENEVNIYNSVSNTWSTVYLPVAVSEFSMNVINDKIYFAGGYESSTSSYSNLVQIYDPAKTGWSTQYLSIPRSGVMALTCINKGYFAGGYIAYATPVPVSTNRVDILAVSSPVADFTASTTVVTAGGFIDFTDQSTNNPTEWLWTFSGGSPASTTEQNPSGIQYLTAGTYDVTLTVINLEGSNTLTRTSYITVNVAPCTVPQGLTTTDITSTMATFNWEPVSGATKYKVSWKISGNNPWTTTTVPAYSKTVAGLLPNTAYLWKVKSVCGPGVTSPFSGNQPFTTNPAKLAFSEPAVLSAYPNPFSDQVMISVSGEMQLPATCFVYDMQGKQVSKFVLNEYQQWMNFSGWTEGNYFIRAIDAQNTSVGLSLTKR